MREIHISIYVGTHTKLYKEYQEVTIWDLNPGETSQHSTESTAATPQSNVIMPSN